MGRESKELGTVSGLCGLLLTSGYERIVHGGRGSYVEFSTVQLTEGTIHIPQRQLWRTKYPWKDTVYYEEWRSTCSCYAKTYFQKKTVKYADYKVGFWYIAVGDCILI